MTPPRACSFIVADKNTEYVFRGFLERAAFHESLGCGEFAFDAAQDLLVAVGANDPGLYARADSYVRLPLATHRRLVVVLDAEWRGSPGKTVIEQDITAACVRSGWNESAVCVAAIDPEIENWVWQDNPIVEEVLGHVRPPSLRQELATRSKWPPDSPKPTQPKETLEDVLRAHRIPRSADLYRRITSRVSVRACGDPAFQQLARALRSWFPPAAPAQSTA